MNKQAPIECYNCLAFDCHMCPNHDIWRTEECDNCSPLTNYCGQCYVYLSAVAHWEEEVDD